MKFPIGIQTFEKLIKGGYVYVDKTESIYRLIDRGAIYFLSRPRRFGKSLLLSTLAAIFEGKRHLFKGLFIEDKIEWQAYPVVHISLNGISNKETDLMIALYEIVNENAKKYNITLENTSLNGRFKELLLQLSQQGEVVLLIDEYDKPLISFLDDLATFEKNRGILKEFYGVIKDADNYLKFVFITGVSRFSKVSIFSDLNNLRDISMQKDFCDICGYSEQDIHHYFTERIAEIAQEMEISTEELFLKVKQKYNGYNFYGKILMYNPWSVLNFLEARELNNYWFTSGTPTFLTKFAERMQTTTEDVVVSKMELEDLNFQSSDMISLLYQTGYLTINEEIGNDALRLRHPNREVAESFRLYLLNKFTEVRQGNIQMTIIALREAMKSKNETGLKDALNPIFANIPYFIYDKDNEKYYHSVMHLIFMLLHYNIQSEVVTNVGRIDSVVEAWNEIWIFEFKINSTAQTAYNQIINNDYAGQYEHHNKAIYGVGVNFDSTEKRITALIMRRIN
ncbi:MAG: AAA family ATPase [Bacteroidia bacterium]